MAGTAAKVVKAALTPQVMIAAVAFVAALGANLALPRDSRPEAPTIEITDQADRTVRSDVRLLLVDRAGLEWQRSESVESAPGDSARLTAVLAALREAMVAEGIWPTELPAPIAFLETVDRRRVAVVDLSPPTGIAVSVATEVALARAITGTAELAGAEHVVFLRGGEPNATLLGHVAVPSSL